MAQESTKPRVLLVSLRLEPYFDDMYKRLLDQLKEKATVQRAKKIPSVKKQIADPATRPAAMIITDAHIPNKIQNPEFVEVWDAILKYVREGGTAILACQFSGVLRPLQAKPFFVQAELPWEYASYHRTTTVLNPNCTSPTAYVGAGNNSSPGGADSQFRRRLQPSYSQKALSLAKVEPRDAWYAADENPVIESRVFAPTHVLEQEGENREAAVVLTCMGKGRLGYVGDVNTEAGSFAVIMAMCGLL